MNAVFFAVNDTVSHRVEKITQIHTPHTGTSSLFSSFSFFGGNQLRFLTFLPVIYFLDIIIHSVSLA